MKFSKLFYLASILFASAVISSACNKKKDTIAKIYVYDENKNPVSSSQVVLYAEPSTSTNGKTLIENDTATTNLSGEAIFNLNDLYQKGQSGVAVLNVKATKDALIGYGVVQVEEEVTSEAKVYIK